MASCALHHVCSTERPAAQLQWRALSCQSLRRKPWRKQGGEIRQRSGQAERQRAGFCQPVCMVAQQRQCSHRTQDSKACMTEHSAADWLATTQSALWAAVLSALFVGLTVSPTAHAVLNSPNARIPRSPQAALRRSIPATNLDVRSIQTRLEDVAFKLRIPQRKPWQPMADDVRMCQVILSSPDKVLKAVPAGEEEKANALITRIAEGLRSVNGAIDARDADKTSARISGVLQDVAGLELLQAPGLPFSVPKDYADRPRLTGRAVVQLVLERPDGSLGYVGDAGGGPSAQARLAITLDGYSAPVTAGNFAMNIMNGIYKGRPLSVTFSSVLAGADAAPGRYLPLEILPAGDFDPLYRTPMEVQAGELPLLPLSITGAVAMAHAGPDAGPAADGLVEGDQFFIFKYDKQSSGLAGLSFDEGQFGVFGYVTEGLELIPQLQTGDIIASAELVQGADRLIQQ